MGSEVIVAMTDCILSLGRVQDTNSFKYDSRLLKKFIFKEGEAVELFSTTLHYSPIEIDKGGYITIVGLIKATNDVLESTSDNPMLTAKNEFMLVHESRNDKIMNHIPGL